MKQQKVLQFLYKEVVEVPISDTFQRYYSKCSKKYLFNLPKQNIFRIKFRQVQTDGRKFQRANIITEPNKAK